MVRGPQRSWATFCTGCRALQSWLEVPGLVAFGSPARRHRGAEAATVWWRCRPHQRDVTRAVVQSSTPQLEEPTSHGVQLGSLRLQSHGHSLGCGVEHGGR